MVRTTIPSAAGRHALRQNQAHHGVQFSRDEDEWHSDEDGGGPRTNNDSGGGNARNRDLRASFASMRSHDDDEKKPPLPPRRLSSSLMNDLSDSNSELAKFLLANDESGEDEDNGLFDGLFGKNSVFDNSLAKSIRNIGHRIVTGEHEVHEVGSMGSSKAWFYSLALEPLEVRRDRIIMLAEAYSIFGALFLAGTWVMYEWGSGHGYGGCRWEETQYCHPYIDRAFEGVMALAISANLFQAMFSSFLWLMSILFSGSHRNWVYGARNLLVLCHVLLCSVFTLTVLGISLGIYSKLAPYWPELAIAMGFTLSVVLYGMWACAHLAAEEISLEFYHFPLWFKWSLFPYPMLRRGGRQKIRERAEKRAKELRARAFQERTMLNPDESKSRRKPQTSVGGLLRRAADSIGRGDFDVSKYEARLEDDWYNDATELRNMSVDVLSKYMPRRLAEEVHNQLSLDKPKAKSIASGILGDEGDDRRVSWNLDASDSD